MCVCVCVGGGGGSHEKRTPYIKITIFPIQIAYRRGGGGGGGVKRKGVKPQDAYACTAHDNKAGNHRKGRGDAGM